MVDEQTGRGWWIRLVLSVVVAAAFFAVLVKQIDFVPDDLSVAPWAVPAYLASLVFYFGTRAGRWYFLVRPLGAVTWSTTTLTALAGIMWIMLLPFRLGELARPLFLAQQTEIGASRALGTVAIERVVDGLMVCALFFAATAAISIDSEAPEFGTIYAASAVVAVAFAAALLMLAAMARWPAAVGEIVDKTIGLLLPAVGRTLAGLARGVAEGMAALPSVRPLLAFAGVTVVYWLINVLGTWVLARGCGLDLDPVQMAAVVAIVNIALLVPGGPAQAGNFQGGVVLGLYLFLDASTVEARGSVFVFYVYVCQLGATVLLGLVAQRRLQLDWRSVVGLSRKPPPTEPPGLER